MEGILNYCLEYWKFYGLGLLAIIIWQVLNNVVPEWLKLRAESKRRKELKERMKAFPERKYLRGLELTKMNNIRGNVLPEEEEVQRYYLMYLKRLNYHEKRDDGWDTRNLPVDWITWADKAYSKTVQRGPIMDLGGYQFIIGMTCDTYEQGLNGMRWYRLADYSVTDEDLETARKCGVFGIHMDKEIDSELKGIMEDHA